MSTLKNLDHKVGVEDLSRRRRHLEGDLEHDEGERHGPVVEGGCDHTLSVRIPTQEKQRGEREEGALEKSLQASKKV